jgi:hypothetical protein
MLRLLSAGILFGYAALAMLRRKAFFGLAEGRELGT